MVHIHWGSALILSLTQSFHNNTLTSLLHGLIQVESGLVLNRIQPRLSVYMVIYYYSRILVT